MNHVIRIITDYSQVSLAIVSNLCLVLCLQGYAKSMFSLMGTNLYLESLKSSALENQLVNSPERISFSPSRFFCDDDQFAFSISNAEGNYRHLPGVSSAYALSKNKISLGEMNRLLLQKIEELTLHTIAQQKLIAQRPTELEKALQRIETVENKNNHH